MPPTPITPMRMRSFAPGARDWLMAVNATAPVARAEVLTKVRRERGVCIERVESERLTWSNRLLFSNWIVHEDKGTSGAPGTSRPISSERRYSATKAYRFELGCFLRTVSRRFCSRGEGFWPKLIEWDINVQNRLLAISL